MTDHDLARWEDDGGFVPPEPDRPAALWWLTYEALRRLFAW